MALDFGDGRGGHGLFDPIPPSSSDSSKKKADFSKDNIDDENENSKEWKEDDLDSQKGNEEDDDDFEDWPTAPPLDILDCIKGYEMVSFDATSVPPPPFEEIEEEEVGKKQDNNEDKKEEAGEDGKQDGGGDIKAKVRLYSFAQTDLHSIPEKKKKKDSGHVLVPRFRWVFSSCTTTISSSFCTAGLESNDSTGN